MTGGGQSRLAGKVARLLREQLPGWTWADLRAALGVADVVGAQPDHVAEQAAVRDQAIAALAAFFRVPFEYLADDDAELRWTYFIGPCRLDPAEPASLEEILKPLAHALARA